jgi:hypothetical protein
MISGQLNSYSRFFSQGKRTLFLKGSLGKGFGDRVCFL